MESNVNIDTDINFNDRKSIDAFIDQINAYFEYLYSCDKIKSTSLEEYTEERKKLLNILKQATYSFALMVKNDFNLSSLDIIKDAENTQEIYIGIFTLSEFAHKISEMADNIGTKKALSDLQEMSPQEFLNKIILNK